MTNAQPKPDNLFGVCAALGEDFGFDPLYLRIALGAGILWNPVAIVGLYAAAGVLVLVTRLLFPNPKLASADVAHIDSARLARPAAPDAPELARAA
jgi:phage shock protein PspC (stress-responsive transcriptional regulator)